MTTQSSSDDVRVICRLPKGNGILVVHNTSRNQKPKEGWGLPGGGFNPDVDTTLEDAAKRELKEETGIDLPESAVMVCVAQVPKNETHTQHFFLVEGVDFSRQNITPENDPTNNVDQVMWASYEDMKYALDNRGYDREGRHFYESHLKAILSC